MRRSLVILAVIASVTGVIAAAVFAQSSETSTGLNSIATHGTPVSFSGKAPSGLGRLGTPSVLTQRAGKTFFQVRRVAAEQRSSTSSSFCYGIGTIAAGKLNPSLIDCTPFPSADTPVLDEIAIEVIDRVTRRTSILSIEGFAADGVAQLRLVDGTGNVVSTATVAKNVFSFKGVSGHENAGDTLVAVDSQGREVWKRVL